MSDRLIRDELLTSERYWSVSNDAKLFYIHILLNADDTARFSGKNFTLRSSCFPSQPVEEKHIERMLDELHAHDLIRLYTVKNERFIFVPRFKQRLRFINSKYPEPPNEINDLSVEKSDSRRTQDRPKTDSSQQKRREEKRREENKKNRSSKMTDPLFEEFWDAYSKKVGKQNAVKEWQKVSPDSELAALMIEQAKATVIAKPDQKYRKDPERWIKGRHWEDDLSSETAQVVPIWMRRDAV